MLSWIVSLGLIGTACAYWTAFPHIKKYFNKDGDQK